jgi:hypothetical protein
MLEPVPLRLLYNGLGIAHCLRLYADVLHMLAYINEPVIVVQQIRRTTKDKYRIYVTAK